MKLIENIMLALSSLKAGKMRALLTMLGIIIGIGSVIAIVTVGNSLTMSITDTMEEFGINQIQVYVSTKERNVDMDMADSDYIPQAWVDELVEKYPNDIESIQTYQMAGSGQAKDGRRYANVIIYGGNANFLTSEKINIIKGRDITDRDVKGAKNICVVSNKFIEKMFLPGENPLGKEVSIHTPAFGILTLTIAGVYEYELPAFMASFAPDEDVETQMVIPITTAKRIVGAPEGFGSLVVRYAKGSDSYAVQDMIQAFFDKKYEHNTNFTVFTQNMEGMLTQMTSMLGTLSIAIAIIAAISLLVGGIGVMNIMLVSVTERTREIGTRKALGARSSAIRFQFIIESMIICLIGGMIGVGTGLLLGMLGSSLLGFPAQPSIPIIIIAVIFSMIIGVFFGFYPANKASKLDPIEALRYE